MSRIWQRILLGAGVLLALFAVYLLLGPDNHKQALRKRLEAEGVVAPATVLDKYVEEYLSYEQSGSGPRKRSVARAVRTIREHDRRADGATVNYQYFVDVEFKTPAGQTVRAKREVLEPLYDGIKVGAAVPILYHPADPAEVSRLQDHALPYRDVSEIYRIMAMVMLSVAAVLCWFGRPRRADDREDDRSAAAAAVDRRISARETRAVATPVPPRRLGQSQVAAAPRGFGRPARAVRR